MPDSSRITRTLDRDGITLKVTIEQTYGPPEEGWPHGTLLTSRIVDYEAVDMTEAAERDILATLGETA